MVTSLERTINSPEQLQRLIEHRQKLLITDKRLQQSILIGPFKANGEAVSTRFGANVASAVNSGTPEEKASFLNELWKKNDKSRTTSSN
jgi:hypothetical protein